MMNNSCIDLHEMHRCASMCIDMHRCASMCIDVHRNCANRRISTSTGPIWLTPDVLSSPYHAGYTDNKSEQHEMKSRVCRDKNTLFCNLQVCTIGLQIAICKRANCHIFPSTGPIWAIPAVLSSHWHAGCNENKRKEHGIKSRNCTRFA